MLLRQLNRSTIPFVMPLKHALGDDWGKGIHAWIPSPRFREDKFRGNDMLLFYVTVPITLVTAVAFFLTS